MSRKSLIIALVITLLVGGGVLAWRNLDQGSQGEPVSNQPSATSDEAETETPPPEPIKAPSRVTTSKLTIDNIAPGDTLSVGDTVKGKAMSREGVLHITIKGESTGKIADYTIKISRSNSTPQPYSVEIIFERAPRPNEKGLLDIYTKENNVRAYSKQVEVVFK